jgi:hypothetical protein
MPVQRFRQGDLRPHPAAISPVSIRISVVLPVPFGADDTDAVAALDAQGEIADDGALLPLGRQTAFGDMPSADDHRFGL